MGNNKNREEDTVQKCMQWKHGKIFFFNTTLILYFTSKNYLEMKINHDFKLLLLLLSPLPTVFY